MNPEAFDRESKPWLPWRDQPTADAVRLIEEGFDAAREQVERMGLTDAERAVRHIGITFARNAIRAKFGMEPA